MYLIRLFHADLYDEDAKTRQTVLLWSGKETYDNSPSASNEYSLSETANNFLFTTINITDGGTTVSARSIIIIPQIALNTGSGIPFAISNTQYAIARFDISRSENKFKILYLPSSCYITMVLGYIRKFG